MSIEYQRRQGQYLPLITSYGMQITLNDIHKYFGPVKANRGISLTVDSGTIHGILGENGAGKSTLMKILSGYSRMTSGEILVKGKKIDIRMPEQAVRHGIGMLYQDPLDFQELTVMENFMLGRTRGIVQKTADFQKEFDTLSDRFGFRLDANALVKTLSPGERQQLELMRLFAMGISVLILDEPTTGISSIQKRLLFDALKRLSGEGKSVILVSHKLEDVEALCDKVTVLSRGEVTGEMEKPFQTEALLRMMFGTPPKPPKKSGLPPGKVILEMEKIFAPGGRTGLRECTASLCENEMIGLAGLEGSGQGVFLRVAAGLTPPSDGRLLFLGKEVRGGTYHRFRDGGINFMPSARLEEGLVPEMSIAEHFALREKSRGIRVPWKAASRKADERIREFNIKGMDISTAKSLSGGNQQRLLLSFLPRKPRILLLENPTRGLDITSANWIWNHLQEYCGKKACIVFSSSELDEILMVADRVLVFFDGKIVKDVRSDETDVKELGMAIAGRNESFG